MIALSSQASSVFQAAAVGLSAADTCEWLCISLPTLREWQRQLRQQTGTRSTTHAVAVVLRGRLGVPIPVPRFAEPKRGEQLTPLQKRAKGARQAVRDGADPLLALAMVCWPPPEYEDDETARMLASRQVA